MKLNLKKSSQPLPLHNKIKPLNLHVYLGSGVTTQCVMILSYLNADLTEKLKACETIVSGCVSVVELACYSGQAVCVLQLSAKAAIAGMFENPGLWFRQQDVQMGDASRNGSPDG